MSLKNCIILLSVFSIINFYCEKEQKIIPETVIWVEKSLPEDTLETGIDANSVGNGIFLQWYPVISAELEGYKLYRAVRPEDQSEPDFEMIKNINIYQNPECDTAFYDEDVNIEIRYMYMVRSYNHSNTRSDPSDTIQYQLTVKSDLVSPIQNKVVNSRPQFVWNNTNVNEIVIRVESFPDYVPVWISRFMNTGGFGVGQSSKNYNFDGSAGLSDLEAGKNYRWRIDCIKMVNPDNTEYSGSESEWQFFQIEE